MLIFLLIAGIWATGVGFGWLEPPAKTAPGREAFKLRWGRRFQILGPCLIIAALALMKVALVAVNH